MARYNHKSTEKKWQKFWEQKNFYRTKDKSKKPKFYQLETFPYPSAAGLHMGHPKGYIAEDIHARFLRMNGKEVLYTMGWDAFGLPTENYAIKVGKSPQEVAKANIKNFKRQIKMFGLSYDWNREINTSSPEYYKWTQWIFLQLFKSGLAYQKLAKVNWCPKDQTVLANEQVVDGCCERCGAEIIQKEMKQWFFKITDYADRLLSDLNGLDWPEETKKRQEDWVGRSEGAEVDFMVKNYESRIKVFTTRPDTIFSATYLVLAPEHELIEKLKSQVKNWNEIEKYINETKKKTELERKKEEKEKTGVELKGVHAINPANKEEISVWIADYVLESYGTGAIMAVPAHDQRDFEFAEKFNLPISNAPLVSKEEAVKLSGGIKKINYKLRDWSVSRQRYWGVPIPIIYCEKCGVVLVSENDLPVKLPLLKDYRPKGKPPLAGSEKFMKVKCPKCGKDAKRDPETLDTFVDSSWYYLRYTDPKNKKEFASKDKLKHWLPIDLYVIGAEHTTAHLLYARFITKFLHDKGYLNFKEPFLKLRHQGMILGPDGRRMSKRWGNVINPDDVIAEYGADTARLYEMFMGPFEQGGPWDKKSIVGIKRFLDRVAKFELNKVEDKSAIHKLIKKIGEDIKVFKFNTAIAAFMEYYQYHNMDKRDFEIFLKLLAPFAPHLAEERWQQLGHKKSIHLEKWPEYNPKLIEDETLEFIVQINGKVRDKFEINKNVSQKDVETLVFSREKIKIALSGKVPQKIIFVPKRLINLVV
ncbi:MAG TPA: class I tRNA ligase family protein [Candidatus Paceibacterota bacterium]